MIRPDDLEVTGTVVDLNPNHLYRVRLRDGGLVAAQVGGALRMKTVRLIPGEKVVVKLSEIDPSRGRIIRRHSSGGE